MGDYIPPDADPDAGPNPYDYLPPDAPAAGAGDAPADEETEQTADAPAEQPAAQPGLMSRIAAAVTNPAPQNQPGSGLPGKAV